jgi:hypothetical protein
LWWGGAGILLINKLKSAAKITKVRNWQGKKNKLKSVAFAFQPKRRRRRQAAVVSLLSFDVLFVFLLF